MNAVESLKAVNRYCPESVKAQSVNELVEHLKVLRRVRLTSLKIMH